MNTTNMDKTLLDILFTDQLPATLTFIAALLGIVSQILIAWKASCDARKNDTRKYELECIRNFYICIINDLISYNVNLSILNSEVEDVDLFNSTDSRLQPYSSILQSIHRSIRTIGNANFNSYYPINKKLNKETMLMMSYMIKASKILDMPVDDRRKVCTKMQIATNGYDVEPLIKMLNKYI